MSVAVSLRETWTPDALGVMEKVVNTRSVSHIRFSAVN